MAEVDESETYGGYGRMEEKKWKRTTEREREEKEEMT